MSKKWLFISVALLVIGGGIFALLARRGTYTHYYYEIPSMNHESLVVQCPYPDNDSEELISFEHTIETRATNLQKLAMVWGFTKYTHLAFISGERCWDAELLQLVPTIYDAHPNEVNHILYEWLLSLGEDGYDFTYGHDRNWDLETWLAEWSIYFTEQIEQLAHRFDEGLVSARYYSYRYNYFITIFKELDNFYDVITTSGNATDWHKAVGMWNEAFPRYIQTTQTMERTLRTATDFSWINSDFLGEHLALRLQRFDGIATANRENAPVYFNLLGNSVFSNQKTHSNMDFSDKSYLLLGLFRMWNAMLYFYPNMDTIDYDWYESLLEYIPQILEAETRNYYVNTLLSLARRLDDAHISIGSRTTHAVGWSNTATESHVLLEYNIGLINPCRSVFLWGDTHYIMQAFADTYGIIVDLRQVPCYSIVHDLAEYIVRTPTRFARMSRPDQFIPGAFIYASFPELYSGGITTPYAFFYDRPVVLLMTRSTMSSMEFAVMSLRMGENVTVIGGNSRGANGDATFLPLPGGETMRFTGLGIFTPEGGQTHRIGLESNIHFTPTRFDGSDELLKAAVEYILARPPSGEG